MKPGRYIVDGELGDYNHADWYFTPANSYTWLFWKDIG